METSDIRLPPLTLRSSCPDGKRCRLPFYGSPLLEPSATDVDITIANAVVARYTDEPVTNTHRW